MKLIKVFLTFITCLSVMTISPQAQSYTSFYVKTEKSEKYDNYVHNVFDKMLNAQENIHEFKNISLGVGIKMILPEEDYSYYVYPIISNHKIIATLHVSKTDEGFASTYTQALAKDFENLKSKTAEDKPLMLIRQGAFLYAEINGERTLLEHHIVAKSKSKSSNTLKDMPEVDTSNMKVKNVYDNLQLYQSKIIDVPKASVVIIPWTVYETQGNQPWCASITTANIVRNNLKRSVTSAQIRAWLGDYDGLTNSQVYSYIKNILGVSSVKYTISGSLSKTTVYNEINGARAIYAAFRDGNDGHALAVIGYNDYAGAYYIHNPWYTYTETMSIGGTYVAGGYRWTWSGGAVYLI